MTNVFWRTTGASLAVTLLLAACVTINVYFPAAAVEQAADRIIEDVWSLPPSSQRDSSSLPNEGFNMQVMTRGVLLLRDAQAQADITISSPAIERIRQSLAERYRQHLQGLLDNGAIGLTADGLVAVRDVNAAPLNQRGRITQLVEQQNRDLQTLYREIAQANNRPDWTAQIQATFAERWISHARPGWWYQANGSWRQK